MVPVFGSFFYAFAVGLLCCLLWRGLSGFYKQDFLMQNMLVGRFLNVAWCHFCIISCPIINKVMDKA